MQETSHHGKTIQKYRELLGISQEELGRRIGRSRRTVVALEQCTSIHDSKLRRTLVWALQIPPELFGVPENSMPNVPILRPLEEPPNTHGRHLSHAVLETFTDNLRMRLNLYYLGSALAADNNLNGYTELLTQLANTSNSRNRDGLLILLSHSYQVKGMIARDQFDLDTAERCFQKASLLAQQARCVELNALAMGRQAVVYLLQKRLDTALSLYETAREISRRSPAVLRAYLAVGHAEVQGKLRDKGCLRSLAEARSLLGRVDPEDDYLLLFHSTRCSEQAVDDCWSQCHALIGMPDVALAHYDKLEKKLDLNMTRMRARINIQYAEALYLNRDLSCCFYLAEGWKLARSTNSQYNIRRASELTSILVNKHAQDRRVKDLLQSIQE